MPYLNPPRPAYYNLPIQANYYKPSRFPITNITLGRNTTVEMGTAINDVQNNYVLGQVVRLLIPSFYGAFQLNNKTGTVIAIPAANQVVLDIDSTGFDPFNPNPSYQKQTPQIVAIGDIRTGSINTTTRSTSIPGAFVNISPN